MLSLLSRCIGTFVILGLAAVGANTVATELGDWKASFDRSKVRPPVVV